MTFSIEVENKFELAQRAIHVQRKSWGEAKESQRIHYPDGVEKRAAAFSMNTEDDYDQKDYLEISVDDDQVELGPSKIDLPANIPFTFIPAGIRSITFIPSGTRTSLRVPAGPPTWKIQVMSPTQSMASTLSDEQPGDAKNNVTVGDDMPGEGDDD